MADPEDEPIPADEATGAGRLARVARAGAAVLRHRDLLIQALELLRNTEVVTARQQVAALAAYEQGSQSVKDRVAHLIERLEVANFGEAVVQLREEKDALAMEGRVLLREGQRELQEFLDKNRPTIEALERASREIAETGRELAASIRVAGKDAADELLRRGRKAILQVETEEYERALFDWLLKAVPRAERFATQILYSFGALCLAAAFYIGAQWFPSLKVWSAVLGVLTLLWLGFTFLRNGLVVTAALRTAHNELDRLAQMNPRERRQFILSKARVAPDPGPGDAASFSARISSTERKGETSPPLGSTPEPPSP